MTLRHCDVCNYRSWFILSIIEFYLSWPNCSEHYSIWSLENDSFKNVHNKAKGPDRRYLSDFLCSLIRLELLSPRRAKTNARRAMCGGGRRKSREIPNLYWPKVPWFKDFLLFVRFIESRSKRSLNLKICVGELNSANSNRNRNNGKELNQLR